MRLCVARVLLLVLGIFSQVQAADLGQNGDVSGVVVKNLMVKKPPKSRGSCSTVSSKDRCQARQEVRRIYLMEQELARVRPDETSTRLVVELPFGSQLRYFGGSRYLAYEVPSPVRKMLNASSVHMALGDTGGERSAMIYIRFGMP